MKKNNIDLDFDMNVLNSNFIRNKNINYIKSDTCIGANIRIGQYWELWMLKYIKDNYIQYTNMIDLGSNIGTTS